ncbi:MAG: hypothetical protein KKF67_00495 [Nanoarchaeota archaeon]|nr:hypothetical protein [Nanoarchaeota archaeon]
MKDTIRLDGSHHSMLRVFVGFYSHLRYIDGVDSTRTGRFFYGRLGEKSGVHYQWYNPTTRVTRLKVVKGRKKQYFDIRAKRGEEEKLREHIRGLVNC